MKRNDRCLDARCRPRFGAYAESVYLAMSPKYFACVSYREHGVMEGVRYLVALYVTQKNVNTMAPGQFTSPKGPRVWLPSDPGGADAIGERVASRCQLRRQYALRTAACSDCDPLLNQSVVVLNVSRT
jgi:hypothetical protein